LKTRGDDSFGSPKAVIECLGGGTQMQESTHIKEEALKLIESLPDDTTWEDLTRLMLERQMIEEGIADLEAGRVWTSDEIREKLGMATAPAFIA
jgi:predicted transcriptional regulator